MNINFVIYGIVVLFSLYFSLLNCQLILNIQINNYYYIKKSYFEIHTKNSYRSHLCRRIAQYFPHIIGEWNHTPKYFHLLILIKH